MNFNESCGCKCRLYSFTVYIHTYESYTRIHTRFFERLEGLYTRACSYVCKISSPPLASSSTRWSAWKEETNVGILLVLFPRRIHGLAFEADTKVSVAIQVAITKGDYLRSSFVDRFSPCRWCAPLLRIVAFPFSVVAVSNLVIFLAGISEWSVYLFASRRS